MANAPSPPNYFARPATYVIKDMADGICYEDHVRSNSTPEFIERSTFPFLRLPVELQVNVADQISCYSDLKAFLLTSKELFDVATPCLYKSVDLRSNGYDGLDERMSEKDEDEKLSQRIESLLIKPANLSFIRVLKTNHFGLVSTQLMDRVLPLLREDFLTEFSYSTKSAQYFPTPSQLQLLWGRQKNLQNLKIYSHIVPSLEEFFNKSERNQKALLKSFAKLTISENSETRSHNEFNMISWPLKNLDLYLIQHLSFHGRNNTRASNILSSLNSLFVAGSFVNLMKLAFKRVFFDETLNLTNMPSLKELSVIHCRAPPGRTLVQAHNFPLRYLMYMASGPLEEIYPFLNQIKGLEDLFIVCLMTMKIATRVQSALISAILSHKETLRILDLEIYPILETTIDAMIWEVTFVMNIQDCKNLVELCLPLIPTRSAFDYRDLIEALPRLSSLTVFTASDLSAVWSPNLVFPTSLQSSFIQFDTYSHDTYRVIRRGSEIILEAFV